MSFTSNTNQPASERFYILEAILGSLIVVATVGAFQLHDATEQLDAAVQERMEYCAIHDRSNSLNILFGQRIPRHRSAAVGNN